MKQKRVFFVCVAGFILITALALAVTGTDRLWSGGSGAMGENGPNAALWREYLVLQKELRSAQIAGWWDLPRPLSPEEKAAREARNIAKAEKTIRGVMAKKGIGEGEALELLIRLDRRTLNELRTEKATREAIREHEQKKHSDDLDPYGQKKGGSIPDRPDTRPRPYW